jgi:hypothetical protein
MTTAPARRQAKKGGLAPVLNRIGNPFVSLLLQSPIHGLLDARAMLITVTGRKTGRTYTMPVGYVRERDTLTVLSRRGRTWWRNLEEPAPVFVRLRGRQQAGIGHVEPLEGGALEEAVKDFFAKMGLHPDETKVRETAAEAVVIHIELEGRR